MEKTKLVKILSAVVLVLLILAVIGRNCFSSCSISCDSCNKEKKEEVQDPAAAQTNKILEEAQILASQYDYDSAIASVKTIDNYDNNTQAKNLVEKWQGDKENLVEFPYDQITHVFVHSLIYDTSRAFDGDSKSDGYNLVMTTSKEFQAIMEEMYKNDFVLVSMHDICTFDEKGERVDQAIMLPPEKKAFVFSIDDCSYYHYQENDGLADKLIIDDNGDVKCEYTDKDGNKLIGDYDAVPMLDTFVKQHPDFSYHNHKGVLALTGYNGVLGYRTDEVYKTRNADELDTDQKTWLEKHPDFDFDKECEDAKKVVKAMKDNGWEFASHTWGHMNPASQGLGAIQDDNEKWQKRVAPIVGKTDTLIFPDGTDLQGPEPYTDANEAYKYFKDQGFHIFCPVDGSQYFIQEGDKYLRMGRRNLDGYRMYHNPEMLSDLFNVDNVFDKDRPTPVPDMGAVYGG